MNIRGPSKTDIEINNKTEEDICPVANVGTVIKQKKHTDYVSFHCFVNTGDRPMVPTTLRYKLKLLTKKDIACNDDKGAINFTLFEAMHRQYSRKWCQVKMTKRNKFSNNNPFNKNIRSKHT